MRLLNNRRRGGCDLREVLLRALAGALARRLRRYNGTIEVVTGSNIQTHIWIQLADGMTFGCRHSKDELLLWAGISTAHIGSHNRRRAHWYNGQQWGLELADPRLVDHLAQPIRDYLEQGTYAVV